MVIVLGYSRSKVYTRGLFFGHPIGFADNERPLSVPFVSKHMFSALVSETDSASDPHCAKMSALIFARLLSLKLDAIPTLSARDILQIGCSFITASSRQKIGQCSVGR